MPKVRLLAPAAVLALSLAGAPSVARPAYATDPATIEIESYDITQTPMSGYGCWTHTYTGSIVDTGRTVSGSVSCGEDADHLADYSGGSGTLNDGIFSTSSDDNQLILTTMNADDGLPIEPVITLHLAQQTWVKGISIYGGDVAWNVLPGALNAMTIEIGGKPLAMSSTPFGPENVLGVPSNDDFDIDYTEQSWIPTRTIVLRDFQADFLGYPFSQFSITEIAVRGEPAVKVRIDVKPGDKDPVRINPSRGRIPVAIFGSSALDVTKLDMGSFSFGVYGWENSLAGFNECSPAQDLNKDGLKDIVCYFNAYAVDWTQGYSTAHLVFRDLAGTRFYGDDAFMASSK